MHVAKKSPVNFPILCNISYFILQTTDPGVGPGGNTHSEGVLANFFNSLLSKNTGQTRSPGTTPNKVAGPNDDCKSLN